jgi:hypothetical protein
MEILHEPEIILAVNGVGWTVVRCGRDEEGAFQEWIGMNYSSFFEAKQAADLWEKID